MIDREKLAKQVKVISQESWSVETNTTVNAMVEYIVVKAFDKLLDHLEPLIESQKTIDPDYVKSELEDFKVKLRYLTRDIEELQNGSKDGGYQNAQGNAKSKRNAAKASDTYANGSGN